MFHLSSLFVSYLFIKRAFKPTWSTVYLIRVLQVCGYNRIIQHTNTLHHACMVSCTRLHIHQSSLVSVPATIPYYSLRSSLYTVYCYSTPKDLAASLPLFYFDAFIFYIFMIIVLYINIISCEVWGLCYLFKQHIKPSLKIRMWKFSATKA